MKKILKTKIELFLSMVFSLFTLFGKSYEKMNSWNYVFNNKTKSIILFLVFSVCYYLVLLLLERLLLKVSIKKQPKIIVDYIFERHPFIIPFLIIFLLWLPIIVLKFPADPGPDFLEFTDKTYKISNHFPPFYVYFSIIFIKIVSSILNVKFAVFFLSLFHVFIMISSFSLVFVYLKKWNISYKFRIILLLFYSLNYLFSCSSMTLYSDLLFSSLILAYILLLTDIMEFNNDNIDIKKIVCFSFISLFICLLKNNGIFLVIFVCLFLIIKKHKMPIKYLFITPIISYVFISFYFSEYCYKDPKIWSLAIPLQQVSRYSKEYHNDIKEEEVNNLNNILNYEKAQYYYNPLIVDDIVNNSSKLKYNSKQRNDFLKVYFKLFFRHPDSYIQAFINNTYNLYYPYQNASLFINNIDISKHNYINYYKNYKTLDKVASIFNNLSNNIVFCIIVNPAVYVWLLLFLLLYALKNKLKLIMLIPLLFVVIFCLFGPTIYHHTRYAYSIMYSILPLFAYYSKCISKKE